MHRFRFFCSLISIYALAVLLTACGEAATNPMPSATVASSDVAATLKSQLAADSVLVNTVDITAADPVVLTIDYQFNDRDVAHAQVDISTSIAIETERVVTAVTKRVVAQVDAGTKIDQVVLNRHLAKGDTAFIQRIDVRDMQAWSAGKLSDDAYRTRWCCNNTAENATPRAYPAPNGSTIQSYPAPGVQAPTGYPAAP